MYCPQVVWEQELSLAGLHCSQKLLRSYPGSRIQICTDPHHFAKSGFTPFMDPDLDQNPVTGNGQLTQTLPE
jgi:hypothetical protein